MKGERKKGTIRGISSLPIHGVSVRVTIQPMLTPRKRASAVPPSDIHIVWPKASQNQELWNILV
jgi:hypothetical protein